MNNSNNWDKAHLYPSLIAVKYPLITLEILIKGNPIDNRYRGVYDIAEFSQLLEITFANNITSNPLPNPNIKENRRELLTAFNPSKKFSLENCSETIQVQARLNPEVARITKNIYTDITKLNVPTASEQILLAIYRLNAIPILFIIREVIVRIVPLIKKIFVLFKISPFNKYVFDIQICIYVF